MSFEERSVGSSRQAALDQQFDAIKVDYERTSAVVESVLRTRLAARTFSLTAFITLLGLALQTTSRALAIAAAILICIAWAEEVRLWWAYQVALRRANELERLYQARLRVLDRPYDPFLGRRLRSEIERHEFGVYATFPRATLAKVVGEVTRGQVVLGLLALATAITCAAVVS